MHRLRLPSTRATVVLMLATLGLACALLVQESGPNQAAHHALVRALASGTAEIDPRETIDAAYVDGRFYAAKAPGLAMFSLPWHLALRAAGLQDTPLTTADGYRQRVWELNLWGAVLPLLVLLLLVYLAVERVVPGYGLATSGLLGAGTLLLPFATLFFDHVLSAALGFAAFLVLLLEKDRSSAWLRATAGLLAGVAIVAEFPLGIVAVVLAGYAAVGERPLRRAAAYVAGVLAGTLPLLAYNTWAFGSPTTLSYTNALEEPVGSGAPVVGANAEGFYGIGLPEPRVVLSLLFSEKGLLVVTPLVLVGIAGLPALARAGRRAEAAVCAAVPLLFLAYNASYYLPFGGQAPGPRFLVGALPFLALPLACALRARPLAAAGIALASAAVMTLATVTDPLIGTEYGIETWLDELRACRLSDTVLGEGTVAVVPFVLLIAVAVALALTSLRRAGGASGAVLLAGGLASWLLVAATTPDLVPADAEHGTLEGELAVVALVLGIGAVLWLAATRGAIALALLVPTLVLATPELGERPRWSLLVAVLWLAGVACAWLLLRRPPGGRVRRDPAAADDEAALVGERIVPAE